MTETNTTTPTLPEKPKMLPGEPESTYRRRMSDWARDCRDAERAEEAKREGAARVARERSFMAGIVAKAKSALSFDRTTISGSMRGALYDERLQRLQRYRALVRKVAATEKPKQADLAALTEVALSLQVTPDAAEADLRAMRKYLERKPYIDQLVADTPKLKKAADDAVAEVKRLDAALKAAKEEQARAHGAHMKAAMAPTELTQIEGANPRLFASDEKLLAGWEHESKQQAHAIRRQPGMAYAV